MSVLQGDGEASGRLAYLFSRFPFVSQTFTDNEMLALEEAGWRLAVASIFPPPNSFRHGYLDHLEAELLYGPPSLIKKQLEQQARSTGLWPADLIARHEAEYGKEFKAAERARNALYFGHAFRRLGVRHVHVPFANRATHSMLFLKVMSGLTFSFTTHGRDFQVDLGSDDLLREMCGEAEFVIAVCDYSRDLLRQLCPDSADKIQRIYNGLDPEQFYATDNRAKSGKLRIISIGRLIEFKGFHILLDALAALTAGGLAAELTIVGEGPWLDRLTGQVSDLGLQQSVRFAGRCNQAEVRQLLSQSEIFVLACTQDASGATDLLPTVITEAMFSSLPVISTRIAGVPEMVIDGQTGLLVEHGNSKALAQAISQLAAEPDRGRKLGHNGKQHALQKFHLSSTSQQLAQMLAPYLSDPTGSCQLSTNTSKVIAFYDLRLARRLDWLAREWQALLQRQARIIVTVPIQGWPPPLPPELLEHVEFLPDGIALDMEWTARANWRRSLEDLRTASFSTLDGTLYLRLARRAVWIAAKLITDNTACLYTPGVEESLTGYLAAQLRSFPRATVFEPHRLLSKTQLADVAADAILVNNGSGKLDGFKDDLQREAPTSRRVRIGPFSYRKKLPSLAEAELSARFERWLDQLPLPGKQHEQ